MKHINYHIAAFFLLLASVSGYAQDVSGQAMPFLSINPSAEKLGFGGISSPSADSYSHFGGVASVPFSDRKFSIWASYMNWKPAGTDYYSAGAAVKVGRRIGITAGAIYGRDKSYPVIDEDGMNSGSFTPSCFRAGAGVSVRITDFLSAGVTLNYAGSILAPSEFGDASKQSAFFADIQLAARFGGLSLAVSGENIGTKLKSDSGESYNLPTAVKAAAGYGFTFGRNHLNAAAELGAVFSGGTSLTAGAGVQYDWNETLFVRGGYHYGSCERGVPSFASVGAGVSFVGININAVWLFGVSGSPLSNTFAVGLGYAF